MFVSCTNTSTHIHARACDVEHTYQSFHYSTDQQMVVTRQDMLQLPSKESEEEDRNLVQMAVNNVRFKILKTRICNCFYEDTFTLFW